MSQSGNIQRLLLVTCVLLCIFVSSVAAGEIQGSADNATQVPVLQETITAPTMTTAQDLPVISRPANMAPVNPAYLQYMEQQQQTDGILNAPDSITVSSGIPVSSHATGAIPLYEDLSHLKGTYVVDDSGLPSSEKPLLHTALPAKYDLRAQGRVSPVKDQGTAGVCWAFATVASLESTLLPGETWDFSENNMKNLLSDLYPEGFTRNFTAGATHKESTAYLVRWTGPVNQSDDPYNATSPYSPANLTVQKHVQRVDYVPDRVNSSDNNNIKTAVQTFGAVYTTYNMSDNTTLPYWNETHYSYYYFGDAGLNHAVAIVGWDDTWSRYNFSTVPSIDGAFIIKNSWGSEWGDRGFFYCSYNDTLIGKDNALFLSSPPKNYDHIYQYDPLGWVSSRYTTDAKIGWAANVFTSTRSQNLSAVSFYTTDTNANYQVWVYVNPNNGPVLNSSGAAFTQNGTFANAGYHTIAIPNEIPLDANDRFAVAVKLINPEYNWSIAYQDWTYRTTNAKAYPGQGYLSDDGSTWTDVTDGKDDKNASICVKSFTRDTHITAPVANFTGTPTSGNAPLTVQFTDTSTGSPTGWAYFFGDENYTAPWTQVNASAGWSVRYGHSSITMPDGSIMLMGGYGGGSYKNDVWRSTDNGATWTVVNASAGWTVRYSHTSVVMPDGSIVLMGGKIGSTPYFVNDVWRSTDNGATWTQVNASAGWAGRYGHTSVVMPDGSIVLMGGNRNSYLNDIWRSTDNGATWTQVNASAGWAGRWGHSSVVMPDGSIVLTGGQKSSSPNWVNDVWRSTDNGATWTQMNASAGWAGRVSHSSVAMPDGSIVLMGGESPSSPNWLHDVWRSKDNGATWTVVNASAGWAGRYGHSSVAMPDGSIVLMGGRIDSGLNYKNDVWRFVPTGSSAQNPSHTYTTTGMYSVTLTATNAKGSNTKTKIGYIVVTGSPADRARLILPAASLYQNTATKIPIRVANIIGGTGISFNLTYDPTVMRVNEITLNQSYVSGSSLDVNATPGLIRLSLTRTEPITIGSPLPLLFLNTTGTGPVGASTPLNFSHATWSTPTFDSQPMDTVNGSILIYRIRGDLNGNGWVDIGDTAKTAYMVVELTPDLIPDADFNNNGVIDTGDATKIACYLVGKIPSL